MEDFLCQSIDDLKGLLKNTPSAPSFKIEAGDTIRNAYQKILKAFNKKYNLTSKQKDNNTALARVLELEKTLKYPDEEVKLRWSPCLRNHLNFIQQLDNIFSLQHANHIYYDDGKRVPLDDALSGKYKGLASPEIWNQSLSNEFGRVMQGNDKGVPFTDCANFIFHNEVPQHKKVTYANFVLDHRPLKPEPFRIRMVVGGDKLDYFEDSGSPAASMLETKILINSTISDASKGAKFMSIDLKDFFLHTIMK